MFEELTGLMGSGTLTLNPKGFEVLMGILQRDGGLRVRRGGSTLNPPRSAPGGLGPSVLRLSGSGVAFHCGLRVEGLGFRVSGHALPANSSSVEFLAMVVRTDVLVARLGPNIILHRALGLPTSSFGDTMLKPLNP